MSSNSIYLHIAYCLRVSQSIFISFISPINHSKRYKKIQKTVKKFIKTINANKTHFSSTMSHLISIFTFINKTKISFVVFTYWHFSFSFSFLFFILPIAESFPFISTSYKQFFSLNIFDRSNKTIFIVCFIVLNTDYYSKWSIRFIVDS